MKKQSPKQGGYGRLYRNFIALIFLTSLAPHLLVGWGIYYYFSNWSHNRLKQYFQNQIEDHRKIVDLFLKERISDLEMVVYTHAPEQLEGRQNLGRIFEALNRGGRYFVDLGVITDQGRHQSYVGPYSLMDKDYSQSGWFRAVMQQGVFISDMFLGFRNSPHFIIAVTGNSGGRRWILRASVDTDYFRSLVESVRIGQTGEAFLLNSAGLFQTRPRFNGDIMKRAPYPLDSFKKSSEAQVIEGAKEESGRNLPRLVLAYAWLKNPRWILVVKQEYNEAFKDINRANWATLIFLHLSSVGIILLTVTITYFIIRMIRRRDQKNRELNDQLVQASKLASMGEISAKVAHELNSPLGGILIYANLLLEDIPAEDPKQKDLKEIIEQTLRCKEIVKDLLEFSRKSNYQRVPCSINQSIQETVDLLSKQSLVRSPLFSGPIVQPGIRVVMDIDPDLPLISADFNRLNQVMVNLIINAVDAMDGKGTLTLRTYRDKPNRKVVLEVSDTGQGIPPENRERIFEPFFTTKEVGKGTGLGLSTVYGIVKEFEGTIEVRSEVKEGTTFIVAFPLGEIPA
ncbi:MAG: ATP-binding protein [Thermodesulfobacteriota bacterium]